LIWTFISCTASGDGTNATWLTAFMFGMPSRRMLLLLARLPPIDTFETAPLSNGRVNRRVSVGTIPGVMRATR
jgi:hypothetical protein